MGTPKAALEWHGSTLLHRTVAVLAETVNGPFVVVASAGQQLPTLPPNTRVVEDPVVGLGPMQGIAAGLRAVSGEASAAFVFSTDMPFLHQAFIRKVLRELEDTGVDVVLPVVRGYRQPLAAAYRTSLTSLVDELVAAGRLATGMLFERCRVLELGERELLADLDIAHFDPDLDSVLNINTPQEYAAARRRPATDPTG